MPVGAVMLVKDYGESFVGFIVSSMNHKKLLQIQQYKEMFRGKMLFKHAVMSLLQGYVDMPRKELHFSLAKMETSNCLILSYKYSCTQIIYVKTIR